MEYPSTQRFEQFRVNRAFLDEQLFAIEEFHLHGILDLPVDVWKAGHLEAQCLGIEGQAEFLVHQFGNIFPGVTFEESLGEGVGWTLAREKGAVPTVLLANVSLKLPPLRGIGFHRGPVPVVLETFQGRQARQCDTVPARFFVDPVKARKEQQVPLHKVEHVEGDVPAFVAVPHQERQVRVLPLPQRRFNRDIPDAFKVGGQGLPGFLESGAVAAPEADDAGTRIETTQDFKPVLADVQRTMESKQDDPLQERLRRRDSE